MSITHRKPVTNDSLIARRAATRSLSGRFAGRSIAASLSRCWCTASSTAVHGKRVWFTEELRPEAESVVDVLSICVRPVRYEKACRLEGVDKGAVSPDYPIVGSKGRFVPVFIDHRAGEWVGDFTYDLGPASRLRPPPVTRSR